MKEDLDSERRSHQRIWAKREKQLERAMLNAAGLYGDIGGILGPNLPQIENLELPLFEESECSTLEPAAVGPDGSPF
jgi:hypothetical protein